MLRFHALFVFFVVALPAAAANLAGIWHATVLNREGQEVAFQLDLVRQGNSWSGALVNSNDRAESTSGRLHGHKLRLEFNYWDGVLEAELQNGEWNGNFTRRYRKEILVRKFHAQRKPIWVAKAASKTDFSGEWLVEINEDGKLSVARALIQQKGSRAQATLMEISGDSGVLSGIVDDRKLLVSRFDGIRATRLEVKLLPDGRMEGMLDTKTPIHGARVGQSTLKAYEASHYTHVKAGEEHFRFSYPDLDGHTVSSDDARFRGKVLLITITGSWCPNCHDEAPLLRELYEKYHAQGLEIVAIAFEYTGEVDRDLRQLRLFRDKYKLPFPILLAGTTEEAKDKLSQLENFAGYPTALYVGRNGKVRGIHAGFDGPATGSHYAELRSEMDSTIRKLIAER